MDSAAARLSPSTRCPVDILRYRDAGMTENLGHHVQRRALSQHQRCTGVPQLVRMPMTQPGRLAQPRECVREVVRVDGCASIASEDQAVILPEHPGRAPVLSLPRLVTAQLGHDLRGKRQSSTRLRGLQFADRELCFAIR